MRRTPEKPTNCSLQRSQRPPSNRHAPLPQRSRSSLALDPRPCLLRPCLRVRSLRAVCAQSRTQISHPRKPTIACPRQQTQQHTLVDIKRKVEAVCSSPKQATQHVRISQFASLQCLLAGFMTRREVKVRESPKAELTSGLFKKPQGFPWGLTLTFGQKGSVARLF